MTTTRKIGTGTVTEFTGIHYKVDCDGRPVSYLTPLEIAPDLRHVGATGDLCYASTNAWGKLCLVTP